MGIYFNPGNNGFRVQSGSEIYVDKTGLITHMNRVLGSEKNCIAVSHARRFGKSQAARMLEAFYSRGCDSRALFEDLAIAKEADWERNLNKFNVIHLDMSTMVNKYKEALAAGVTQLLYEVATAYDSALKDGSWTEVAKSIATCRKAVKIRMSITID